jgi:hypothetical protein
MLDVQHDDPRLPTFELRPDERLVTVLGEEAWPAVVSADGADRWNGFLSPRFRPAVARLLAAWQATDVCELEDDQLVLSPDGQLLVHLVFDESALADVPRDREDAVLPRAHEVWAVYRLLDGQPPCGPPVNVPGCADRCGYDAEPYCEGRIAVGAWHWTWQYAEADETTGRAV